MTPKTTLHLTLKSTLESVGVKLRLRDGKPEWRRSGLSVTQRDWLARHQNDLALGLVEGVSEAVFGPAKSVAISNGPAAERYWASQRPSEGSRPGIDAAAPYWRSVARRVLAGEFDTPARQGGRPTPPSGSMAKSLTAGMRAQSDHPEVRKALDYLNGTDGTPTP